MKRSAKALLNYLLSSRVFRMRHRPGLRAAVDRAVFLFAVEQVLEITRRTNSQPLKLQCSRLRTERRCVSWCRLQIVSSQFAEGPPGTVTVMVRIEQVVMTDDIDGSTDDVVTCAFGLGDSQFEIDLNEAHREELENALAKFIEFARPVGSARPIRQRRQAAPSTNKDRTHAIRQWAKEAGMTISDRGRISKEVQAAFDEAH